mgnify:CR=1 FL=1
MRNGIRNGPHCQKWNAVYIADMGNAGRFHVCGEGVKFLIDFLSFFIFNKLLPVTWFQTEQDVLTSGYRLWLWRTTPDLLKNNLISAMGESPSEYHRPHHGNHPFRDYSIKKAAPLPSSRPRFLR